MLNFVLVLLSSFERKFCALLNFISFLLLLLVETVILAMEKFGQNWNEKIKFIFYLTKSNFLYLFVVWIFLIPRSDSRLSTDLTSSGGDELKLWESSAVIPKSNSWSERNCSPELSSIWLVLLVGLKIMNRCVFFSELTIVRVYFLFSHDPVEVSSAGNCWKLTCWAENCVGSSSLKMLANANFGTLSFITHALWKRNMFVKR